MRCVFSVKTLSEVTYHRNTPSPSLQSFGGYRTDHGGFFRVLPTELICLRKWKITWNSYTLIHTKALKNATAYKKFFSLIFTFTHLFHCKTEMREAFLIFLALCNNNCCIVFWGLLAVWAQTVKDVAKAGGFLTTVCPSCLVSKECLHGHDLHRKPFLDMTVLFFLY